MVPLLEIATWTFGAVVALIFGTLFAWLLLAVFRRWAPLLLVAAGVAAPRLELPQPAAGSVGNRAGRLPRVGPLTRIVTRP